MGQDSASQTLQHPGHAPGKTLLPAERRALIVSELQDRTEVSVSELCQRFGVSDVCIRRDLEQLESERLLTRMHGGVRAVKIPAFRRALFTNVSQKQRIGQVAASLVKPGQAILLDSGSTVLEVARRIPGALLDGGTLTVVTRALYIATEISLHPQTRLIVLGGLYEHEYDHFAGAHVQTILRDLRVDTLYMGVDGVTIDGGLMTHDILESGLHEMMASIAQRVVVVVDSSKIGVTKLQRTLPLDRVNTFITDAGAPTEFLEALRKMGAEVIVAPLE